MLVKPTLTDWRKDDLRFDQDGRVSGWTVTEQWRLETQNSKDIEVAVDIRRNFTGDWSLKTDAVFEKVEANRVKFLMKLKPREKRVVEYEVGMRMGVNVGR